MVGASAASNSFISPPENSTVSAGDQLHIEWTNITGSKITLLVKEGSPDNLQTVTTIGQNVSNDGTVEWKVPADFESGRYALEVIDDDNKDLVNYSNFFNVEKSKNGTSSSKTTSSTAPSSISFPNSSSAVNANTSDATNTVSSRMFGNSSKASVTQTGNLSTSVTGVSTASNLQSLSGGAASGASSRLASESSGSDASASANLADKLVSISMASSLCAIIFALL